MAPGKAFRKATRLSAALAPHASAIHAYDVSAALTYVKRRKGTPQLPNVRGG